jgi:hypothetical protein
MIALGHRVSVCRSLEDVLTALEAAGVPADRDGSSWPPQGLLRLVSVSLIASPRYDTGTETNPHLYSGSSGNKMS